MRSLPPAVTFANELASICERVGADAAEVERALRLEPRIGPRAYIKPGAAFAGGTLARDIVFLTAIAGREGFQRRFIGSVMASNEAHKHWPVRRLVEHLGSVSGPYCCRARSRLQAGHRYAAPLVIHRTVPRTYPASARACGPSTRQSTNCRRTCKSFVRWRRTSRRHYRELTPRLLRPNGPNSDRSIWRPG